MGVDINMYVAVRDANTGAWRSVPVYTRYRYASDEMHLASPYNGRDSEMFDWLTKTFWSRGIPDDTPADIKKIHDEFEGHDYGATYTSLTKLALSLHSIPKKEIVDWDEDTGEPIKGKSELRVSVKSLIKSIETFLDISGEYAESDDVRIYWWFDS